MGEWLNRYRQTADRSVLKPRIPSYHDCHKSQQPDWLSVWERLSVKLVGIKKSDPRYSKIRKVLHHADCAFEKHDWEAVEAAIEEVEKLVSSCPPDSVAPLRRGWRVAYCDLNGRLLDGIVVDMDTSPLRWTVRLESGLEISAHWIVGVTEIRNGRDIAGWTVKRFGLDGQRDSAVNGDLENLSTVNK